MKILFIQRSLFTYYSIMSLSGYLRHNRHECFVVIESECKERDLLKKINDIKPDFIGFSVVSSEHAWLVNKVRVIKSRFGSIPIVVGGVHAILYPEAVISVPGVDYVCYGEGELTLKQLMELPGTKSGIETVGGLYFRKNGEICNTGLNKLIALGGFSEDRGIYYREHKMLRQAPMKNFSSSRGCPFKCSFCGNAQLMKRFEGLGPYIRRKSVEGFVAELENVKNDYGMKSIFITDDLFVLDKEWLKKFAFLYRDRINIPFLCTCRADAIDKEAIDLLVSAGCHTVSFGVESGNEKIRTEILKKYISDDQLLSCAALLNKAGIRSQTSNMFCLPDETVEDAIKTIDLNVRMKTSFMMSSIFMPFPKTELANLCIKKGVLKKDYSFEDMPSSFVTRSVLKLKDRGTLERLQKVAVLIVQYPRLRAVLIFSAKYIRSYSFHFILYLIGTVLRFKAERKLSLWDSVRYIWSYRKGV